MELGEFGSSFVVIWEDPIAEQGGAGFAVEALSAQGFCSSASVFGALAAGG